ncbi:hypothetical protein [Poriferisphaera corsica]|nr:hypothetical protein [Poriferisphaera corsica]
MKFGFEIKQMFFDSSAVKRGVDRATRRVFSRFGAYVRRTAKQSIRKRKKPAPPGKPPSSHTGLLKRFIFFGYDKPNKSVVIGPAKLSQNNRGEAPSLLEYGGPTQLKRNGKVISAHFRGRAFMGPAFEEEQPKLSALWRNSVRPRK